MADEGASFSGCQFQRNGMCWPNTRQGSLFLVTTMSFFFNMFNHGLTKSFRHIARCYRVGGPLYTFAVMLQLHSIIYEDHMLFYHCIE